MASSNTSTHIVVNFPVTTISSSFALHNRERLPSEYQEIDSSVREPSEADSRNIHEWKFFTILSVVAMMRRWWVRERHSPLNLRSLYTVEDVESIDSNEEDENTFFEVPARLKPEIKIIGYALRTVKGTVVCLFREIVLEIRIEELVDAGEVLQGENDNEGMSVNQNPNASSWETSSVSDNED
ncbi:hypothetical protein K469DRAFT_757825 [Zopfia rhizophila CBS 207.26]|uniref:Uncharacterized protein n=1 Tax=Zopfia rhizophila CBS 207.26 TaxID=1314779 RepID=A0A6A6EXD7_9PEZI|nr:hypothetical protein K469DRAFT_757825 [Zopfia rhizophila CBS 207.26]